MPTIIELFNRNKRNVDKLVDTSFYRLLEADDPLNGIMPVQNYTVRELLMMKFSHSKPTIARIIAEDQEVPITKARMVLTEELLSECKLGKAYGFTDQHYVLMQKMDGYLAQNTAVSNELANEIKRYFFGLAEDLAPAIVNRMTQMMFQVLTTGQCVFTDPLTGARVNLTYPNVIATLMPAALTAGDAWNQPATAKGIDNLRNHSRAYYDIHGKYPDNAIFRMANIRQLADQASTKRYKVINSGGTNASADDISNVYLEDAEVIDIIRRVTNIPNVQMFDGMYSDETAAGVVNDIYYLPDNHYVFVDNGVVERAMVPTVEKDFAPGIYSLAERKSNIPRRDQLAGVGNGVPACFDDRKLAARKVA